MGQPLFAWLLDKDGSESHGEYTSDNHWVQKMVSMGLFESWPTTVSNEATKLAFIMKSALRSLGSTLDSSAEHKAMKEPVRNKIQTK